MSYHRDGRAPGGGVYHLRDPRTDPRPGDMLACGATLVRVDHVALGEVVGVAFAFNARRPSDIVAVPIAEWIEATREAGVVVLPEDDPRHTATILEAG